MSYWKTVFIVFLGLWGLSVVLVLYSLGLLDESPAAEAARPMASPAFVWPARTPPVDPPARSGRDVASVPRFSHSADASPPVSRSSTAEDNHRRVLAIQERERRCQWWRERAVDYDLLDVRENIRRYCQ
jgi:hypothetical protein